MFARSRASIALGYVSILALILVLFGVVVVLGFWDEVNGLQDKQLAREARAGGASSSMATPTPAVRMKSAGRRSVPTGVLWPGSPRVRLSAFLTQIWPGKLPGNAG